MMRWMGIDCFEVLKLQMDDKAFYRRVKGGKVREGEVRPFLKQSRSLTRRRWGGWEGYQLRHAKHSISFDTMRWCWAGRR